MTGIVIPDGGTIGSTSDTDAIAISSGGNVTISQTLDGGAIGSAVTMSANQACVKTALNASGDAPIYACRAWVNFNGTGTVAIRASGNVSSITDNGGNGDYTVNFTNDMPDGNYSVAGSGGGSSGSRPLIKTPETSGSFNTNNFKLNMINETTAVAFDSIYICLSVFR